MSGEGRDSSERTRNTDHLPEHTVICTACGVTYTQRSEQPPAVCGACGARRGDLTISTDVGDSPSEPERKGAGRPTLPREMRRSERIVVSLRPCDHARFLREAEAHDQRLNEWALEQLMIACPPTDDEAG